MTLRRTMPDRRFAPPAFCLPPPAGLACIGCSLAALLASPGLAPRGLAQEVGATPNRFTVSTRFSIGIKTEIRHGQPIAPPFDDGLLAQDVSGSTTTTWNWGYDVVNQVNSGAGNIDLHSTPRPFLRDNSTERFTDDPQAGFELGYGRELGSLKLSGNRKLIWGLEGAFGSLDINQKRESTLTGTVARNTSSYSYGALVPGSTLPPAGYRGSFAGPGALLSYHDPTTPAPVSAPATLTSSLSAKVDGLVYGLRMGPFLEAPLFERVSLQIGGGLAAVNADAEFSYTEAFSLAAGATGGPPGTRIGKGSRSEWLLGVYANASLAVAITRNVSLVVGAQFQNLENLTIAAGDKSATLRLGQTIEILGGLRFSF